MDTARLRKIPLFSDLDDDETLSGWDVRRLRKSAPRAVEHLRDVVARRREQA